MDALDRALIEAWWRKLDAGELGPGLSGWLRRPLRSWALTIRAGDARLRPGIALEWFPSWLEDNEEWRGELRDRRQWNAAMAGRRLGLDELEAVSLIGAEVKSLCRGVRLEWPGVPLRDAARRLGISDKTIAEWGRRGVVRIRRFAPRKTWNDVLPDGVEDEMYFPHARRRQVGQRLMPIGRHVLAWSPGLIDPGGGVFTGPWGDLRDAAVERVPDDFVQVLWRGQRRHGRNWLWKWVCEGCGEAARKLMMPMSVRTMGQLLGMEPLNDRTEGHPGRFMCLRCAGVAYECTDRKPGWQSNHAPRDAKTWDFFVRRISGGVLSGKDLAQPEGFEVVNWLTGCRLNRSTS